MAKLYFNSARWILIIIILGLQFPEESIGNPVLSGRNCQGWICLEKEGNYIPKIQEENHVAEPKVLEIKPASTLTKILRRFIKWYHLLKDYWAS